MINNKMIRLLWKYYIIYIYAKLSASTVANSNINNNKINIVITKLEQNIGFTLYPSQLILFNNKFTCGTHAELKLLQCHYWTTLKEKKEKKMVGVRGLCEGAGVFLTSLWTENVQLGTTFTSLQVILVA